MFDPTKLTSELPTLHTRTGPGDQRSNLTGALEQARRHLEMIRHNPRATAIQNDIIKRYEQQLAELNDKEWYDT